MVFPLFLLAAWGSIEVADPFPNSLWILRVLTTKYLVHVRADLTVGGEKLVLERTIRCFTPKRDAFLVQAGDNVAATTKTGRLFIINLKEACMAPLTTIHFGTQAMNMDNIRESSPLYLSKEQLATPVVFEIHGGREAEQIDAYIARDALREGYHGVKLEELSLEAVASRFMLKDWTAYEWFGGPSFARPYEQGESKMYLAGYLVQVPKERWTTLTHLDAIARNGVETHPEYRARLQGYVDSLLALEKDTVFQHEAPQYQLVSVYRTGGFILPFDSLIPARADIGERSARVSMAWALRSLIPCVFQKETSTYLCDYTKDGVLIYKPWIGAAEIYKGGQSFAIFDTGVGGITAINSSISFLYSIQEQKVFVTDIHDAYLRR
jgi:hypothetical protein